MNILRKLALGVVAFILPITLAGLAWSHVVVTTIGNRDTVRSWFEDSGAYNKLTDVVLDSAKQDKSSDEIPLDNPEIRQVANQVFNADFLRSNSEAFLNGIYDWLEGKSDTLNFQINVADAKNRLASGVASYVTNRAAGLPKCKSIPTEFDVYNATCLPPGVSAEQAGEQARSQVLNSQDFLPNSTFSAADIKFKDENGQTTSLADARQLKQFQDGYQWARRVPIILGILSILLMVGVVMLSQEKRLGFKRVAGILIFAGITLGVSYLLIDRGSLWLKDHPVTSDSPAIRDFAGSFIREVAKDVSGALLWYAIGYILLAIAIFLGVKFVNREPKPAEPVETTENKPALNENKTTKK